MTRRYSNVIGVDDGPFERSHRGDVALIGVVFTRSRLDGVMLGKLRKDGANATKAIASMIEGSPFVEHAQLILLGGITFGGFNVVDIAELHERLERPVLVLARRKPKLAIIRETLLDKVPGGARKWALIDKAGPMEPCAELWVQRAGLTLEQAGQAIRDLTIHGKLPEPVRVAHLIAGGYVEGLSRGRA